MQKANIKMQIGEQKMEEPRKNLTDRFLNFAVRNIKLTLKFNRIAVGRYIGNQLIRATTSCGANYEEACGAESKDDFIHKMQIVLKELKETLYWLKLLKEVELIPEEESNSLLKEASELLKIVARSVITAKNRKIYTAKNSKWKYKNEK